MALDFSRYDAGSYVVAYQTGKLLYVSGHIPMTPEGVLLTGTVSQMRLDFGVCCTAPL